MSVVRGCSGKVFASATGGSPAAVAEVQSWNFTSTSDPIDASEMGACTKKFVAGPVETSGEIAVNWDLSDTEQVLLGAVGSTVAINLYPDGNATGKKFYKATSATIVSAAHSEAVNGLMTSTFGFFVNGAMTSTAVP